MELTDEAKAEIKTAIDILKSDGVHFTKAMQKHLKTQNPEPPADPKTPSAPVETAPETGGPPPVKEPTGKPPADPGKKRGLWWGDRE